MAHPYDNQYAAMNEGAHRRLTPNIGAPAVTWQRNFWRYGSDESFIGSVNLLLKSLFSYLLSQNADVICPNFDRSSKILTLFDGLSELKGGVFSEVKNIEKSDFGSPVRHDVFYVSSNYGGFNISIICRRHREYVTLLFTGDFSFRRNGEILDTSKQIYSHFDRIHAFIIERFENKSSEDIIDSLSDEEEGLVASSRQLLIEGFKSIVSDICNKSLRISASREEEGPLGIGSIFGEFFGVILGLKYFDKTLDRVQPLNPSPGKRVSIPAQVEGTRFDDVESRRNIAVRVVDACWPFIRYLNGERDYEKFYGKPEYTISLLQGGRAIYATSLGRTIRDRTASRHEPVIYIAIVSYRSRWRLGRLVDRIHWLGTLRLAALRDIAQINEVSQLIEEGYAALSSLTDGKGSSKNSAEIEKRLTAINGKVEGGLLQRVIRSQYYVSTYERIMDSMKAETVEGFQHYAEFVRRRVFDTYAYIRRVGASYENLLMQRDAYVVARQRRENAELQSVMAKNTEATTELLRLAEWFIGLPVAYYLGTIFYHFGEYLSEKRSAFLLFRIDINVWKNLPKEHAPYYLLTLSCVIAFLLWRHIWPHFQKKLAVPSYRRKGRRSY